MISPGNENRSPMNKIEKVLKSKSAKHLLGCPKELPCGAVRMALHVRSVRIKVLIRRGRLVVCQWLRACIACQRKPLPDKPHGYLSETFDGTDLRESSVVI